MNVDCNIIVADAVSDFLTLHFPSTGLPWYDVWLCVFILTLSCAIVHIVFFNSSFLLIVNGEDDPDNDR